MKLCTLKKEGCNREGEGLGPESSVTLCFSGKLSAEFLPLVPEDLHTIDFEAASPLCLAPPLLKNCLALSSLPQGRDRSDTCHLHLNVSQGRSCDGSKEELRDILRHIPPEDNRMDQNFLLALKLLKCWPRG